MSILNFFRRFRQEKIIETEKISFPELGNWLELKDKEMKLKEKNVISEVEKKADALRREAEEKISALRNFNLESKKAEDRLKVLSEEGRKKYIESVENILNSLKNLNKEGFEKVISDIDRILFDFNKKSASSYEQATILIGKEMAETRETIKKFSKEIAGIFNTNKPLITSLKMSSFIHLKLKNLEKTEKEIKESAGELSSLIKEISEKESENKKTIREMEETKKSREYLNYAEKKEKVKLLNIQLEKEIFDLRQMIDFKALGNFFHIFENEMSMVNSHKYDFHENFKKDSGKTLLFLLEESGLGNSNTYEKIKFLQKMREEISLLESEVKKELAAEKINQLRSGNEKIILKIEDLKNRKTKEEKRLKNYETMRKEIIEEISKNIKNLGAEID